MREHAGIGVGKDWDFSNPCFGANNLFYETEVKVDEKEVPVYEDKWIPDSIVSKCEICGMQKP